MKTNLAIAIEERQHAETLVNACLKSRISEEFLREQLPAHVWLYYIIYALNTQNQEIDGLLFNTNDICFWVYHAMEYPRTVEVFERKLLASQS